MKRLPGFHPEWIICSTLYVRQQTRVFIDEYKTASDEDPPVCGAGYEPDIVTSEPRDPRGLLWRTTSKIRGDKYRNLQVKQNKRIAIEDYKHTPLPTYLPTYLPTF